MRIWQTDIQTGALIGEAVAQVSPLEPEVRDESGAVVREAVYLIPAGAVTVAPPAEVAGKRRHWNREAASWVQRDIPAPVVEAAPVPVCSAWQIRKAFNRRAMRAQVEQYVATAPQDVKDGYEFASEWRADDMFVIQAARDLGMTDQQRIDLIAWAATL